MFRSPLTVLLSLILLASCGHVTANRTLVQSTGPDELLKLRAGPGLGYKVVLGLPDGTALNRHTCMTETGQLWCKVSLANTPKVSGYVSADYLSKR
jgi:uncharacterized protein YraI